jgi:hypothetical protein
LGQTLEPTRENSKEFDRAVRSCCRVRGQFKLGRVPAQRRQVELEFRSLAGLAVWLDQEEELSQLVPEEFKELPALSKSC